MRQSSIPLKIQQFMQSRFIAFYNCPCGIENRPIYTEIYADFRGKAQLLRQYRLEGTLQQRGVVSAIHRHQHAKSIQNCVPIAAAGSHWIVPRRENVAGKGLPSRKVDHILLARCNRCRGQSLPALPADDLGLIANFPREKNAWLEIDRHMNQSTIRWLPGLRRSRHQLYARSDSNQRPLPCQRAHIYYCQQPTGFWRLLRHLKLRGIAGDFAGEKITGPAREPATRIKGGYGKIYRASAHHPDGGDFQARPPFCFLFPVIPGSLTDPHRGFRISEVHRGICTPWAPMIGNRHCLYE
jgi:hypothetical protein